MDLLMQFEIQITLFLQHLGTWLVIPFKGIPHGCDAGDDEFHK